MKLLRKCTRGRLLRVFCGRIDTKNHNSKMVNNRKGNDYIIQCSICEWTPDGKGHWTCSCGHKWDTFTTKGKCPNCGIQWRDTDCPSCGTSLPHEKWYLTWEESDALKRSGNPILYEKKRRIESKLISYGIRNQRISYLPYLDHSNETFQTEYEAGCRMMILYALSEVAHELKARNYIIDWLKNEGIWNRVSPMEKEFLTQSNPDRNIIIRMSWRIEASLTLGWCFSLISDLPDLNEEENRGIIEEFEKSIPEIGDSLLLFLSKLEFRDLNEIYEENLFNELATSYFRDLLFNGNLDESSINRSISFERHQVLNWLRKSYAEECDLPGISWDETDTST